jgi:hypothetical protein
MTPINNTPSAPSTGLGSTALLGSVSGLQCRGWDGPCESTNATHRRQNTRYADDARNWVTLCDDCMKANHEHWSDMWADYYANCM